MQETLDLAARYLRVLAAVERAHSLGAEDEIVSLLSGVDPSDLRALIGVLETAQTALFMSGRRVA